MDPQAAETIARRRARVYEDAARSRPTPRALPRSRGADRAPRAV